jgi:alkyl sulfatase BDS1-like metallo-beta-lactamase superfamily hydrolase
MTIEQVFDALAVRTMSEQLGGVSLAINWIFTDLRGTPDERWVLGISNRTMYSSRGHHDSHAVAAVTMSRSLLLDVVTQDTTFLDAIKAGQISLEGDAGALITIFGNLDTFSVGFPIVEP